jgi:hypothetical protein
MQLNQLKTRLFICLWLLTTAYMTFSQEQLHIDRIDQMANEPSPYSFKDWKQVAIAYDSFVYNQQLTGQYLPLSYDIVNGINYPDNAFFGMHTYVGTNSPKGNEAINVLPSLVGASLVGIDKTNQYNRNYILMSQDFFNKKNGENIYLNGNSTSSGHDWWYDLMPNVFFYQLYDLYGNIGDAEYQFTTIADRFTEAVTTMGGSEKPWSAANLNYRAFSFIDQKPNPSGVKEPEAAGAYAWVLYNAYVHTRNTQYLKAAEWSMEFLNKLNTNPSYELQLPYGIYTAARMNAELGTNYDVEKMVNWAFNRGPLRGWGTIVGNWSGYSASGLVGEANDGGNDYAFLLNGLHQASTLVPMLRYDKRFANAIGKWMLHLTNASRWFYPDGLPADKQDDKAWSDANVPDGVIAHEALREKWNGTAPFATGDAKKGGWAATNLSLYSSSSIGYLGAMVRATNVEKILLYDMRVTDFFQDNAYPTWLTYNPYTLERNIDLDLGTDSTDVYDAVSEKFLIRGKTGMVSISIPAQTARILVLAPANGSVSYDKNIMKINNIPVDYDQHSIAYHFPPVIQSLVPEINEVEKNKQTIVYSSVRDKDSDAITYHWSATNGNITGTGTQVVWTAPDILGTDTLRLIVTDETGLADTAQILIETVNEKNIPPVVTLSAIKNYTQTNETIAIASTTFDANGDALTYEWSSTAGTINGQGATIDWTSPGTEGIYEVSLKVTDSKGAATTTSMKFTVYNFPGSYDADLIAWYPFSGNTSDSTANELDGELSGARYFQDFHNQPKSALLFDGVNDNVTVPHKTVLDFTEGVTLSCLFQASSLPDKESFILSQGSWQNRMKVSIIPEKKLRWTINTTNGIVDLDSDEEIKPLEKYHLIVSYDGTLMTIYLNGRLSSAKFITGKLKTTDLAFTIGQMLPDNTDYNFSGIIDEVKIFNNAVTPAEAQTQYKESLLTTKKNNISQNIHVYPNPASSEIYIETPGDLTNASITIMDMQGNKYYQQKIQHSGIESIDISSIKPGLYSILLLSDQGISVCKFIKIE